MGVGNGVGGARSSAGDQLAVLKELVSYTRTGLCGGEGHSGSLENGRGRTDGQGGGGGGYCWKIKYKIVNLKISMNIRQNVIVKRSLHM